MKVGILVSREVKGLALVFAAQLAAATLPAQTTNPIVFGGFDLTRSGDASFTEGASFSEARAAVLSNYPAATFVSFPTLTASNLAPVNVLVIGTPATITNEITPLDADEQTALLDFVHNGGAAILFTDNDSFASQAAAANASFLSPFGLSGGGTLISEVVAEVPAPENHPVTSGPFGNVQFFVQFVPGAITNLGPHATVLATNYEGVAAAVINPGQLGPGSGPVVFFSDISGFWDTDGYFPTNAALFLNAVEFARSPLPRWRLNIERLGNQVLLRWPAAATNLLLESTTNLAPGTVWTPVPEVPAVIGDENVVTNDAIGMRFYRLRGPVP
ncbi:MAG: hypothetical protein N3I86_06510 [Verrucomicrobiae bacterium]|nr:hypothetical protein [Verrucomicrobiae bacterium]